MLFFFIPLGFPTFLKYACANTKHHKEKLPEAASWFLAVVEVDIEYTDAVLIRSLCISKLFFQRNLPTQTQMNSSLYKVIRNDLQNKVNAGRIQGETQ